MSYASRKNIKGQQMIERRRRKRESFQTIWGSLEFGPIETGRKWEGNNGTKYLNDSLKLNKMLDMIQQLIIACDER